MISTDIYTGSLEDPKEAEGRLRLAIAEPGAHEIALAIEHHRAVRVLVDGELSGYVARPQAVTMRRALEQRLVQGVTLRADQHYIVADVALSGEVAEEDPA